MTGSRVVALADGAYVEDTTGRRCVDLHMGFGSQLHGHRAGPIVDAGQAALAGGVAAGQVTELVVRWERLVCELVPCAEAVRFTCSGSEASQLATRLARAHTGRQWVMRFSGHYHGCHDEALVGGGTGTGEGLHPLAGSRATVVDETDVDTVEDALRTGRFAAVVLEPGGGSAGLLPFDAGMLARLRESTVATGTLLVFDEAVSGFRYAPGGVEELCGVSPDLTILSKVLTGGLPGAAVAGRADVMALLAAGEPDGRPARVTYASTFAGHPVTAAAGVASLELARTGDAQKAAENNAVEVADVLRRCARDADLDVAVFNTSSVVHVVVGAAEAQVPPRPSRGCLELVQRHRARQSALQSALARRGVVAHPVHAWISTAHGPDVCADLEERARLAFADVTRR